MEALPLLNTLLHALMMNSNYPEIASIFKHPSDGSYDFDSFQDINLGMMCSILNYVSWRRIGQPIPYLSQEEQLVLDYTVHTFLAASNHQKVDIDFLRDTGITTAQELARIPTRISDYCMAKYHREVGNNNRVSHGNAPANLPPTQVGFTLAPPHPSVPRYYPNFPHAEPSFQNQQYHDGLAQAQVPPYSSSHYHHNLNAGGLSAAQQYEYRPFSQTERSSQNMQYDGHMFPPQYMMERAANSMPASTAGQSHGLSDSGYQLSNSHKRRRL